MRVEVELVGRTDWGLLLGPGLRNPGTEELKSRFTRRAARSSWPNNTVGEIKPGTYTFEAKADNYDPVTSSVSQKIPGGSSQVVNLVLKPNYKLNARWIDTSAFCGDNVKLAIDVVPVPPAVVVTIEILHPSTGATVDTLSGTLTGGHMETTWALKSQTSSWRTDLISFRAKVSGVGLSGLSINKVGFKARPTTT
jgi:hypothetical protein